MEHTDSVTITGPGDDPLAARLTASGKLTLETLSQIQQLDRRDEQSLGRLLIKLGLVAERDVAEALADIHGAP